MSRTTLSVDAAGLRVSGITAELDVSGGPLIVALILSGAAARRPKRKSTYPAPGSRI
jgi:hypothetical protein